MHHAVPVQDGDAGGDLGRAASRAAGAGIGPAASRSRRLPPSAQAMTEYGPAVGQLADGVHADQPLVVEPAQQAGLVEEALPYPQVVVPVLGQHLDRHPGVEHRVVGQPRPSRTTPTPSSRSIR